MWEFNGIGNVKMRRSSNKVFKGRGQVRRYRKLKFGTCRKI